MYERIHALREYRDMSQKAIAAELHISQRAYSHYENGTRSIPTEILSRLADLHGTSTDYIIGRTDEKRPYKPKKK